MTRPKVYYIEDELNLGRIVSDSLMMEGFEVRWETDGERVMAGFDEFMPDVVVLDIMLPKVDGYALCTQMRLRYPTLPVIFLTARVETKDLVRGFECGGTDYVRKPFSLEELVVRIRNQMHLVAAGNIPVNHNDEDIEIGSFRLRSAKFELETPDGTVHLSPRDREILLMLARNQNQVVDRRELLMQVWGDDSFFNSRNLDVYIRKIRTMFDADPSIRLQTLKGKGYLLLVGG